MTMKSIKFLCMAMLAMLAIACNPIKTEATVDVTVLDQSNKPVAGVMVARFNNSSSAYFTNADEKHETNASGVAHFELKTLEDLGPAQYDSEGATSPSVRLTRTTSPPARRHVSGWSPATINRWS